MAFIFKTPLEKNMVIDTEPKFIFAEGVVGIENTLCCEGLGGECSRNRN
jgi:hypothetical protein